MQKPKIDQITNFTLLLRIHSELSSNISKYPHYYMETQQVMPERWDFREKKNKKAHVISPIISSFGNGITFNWEWD